MDLDTIQSGVRNALYGREVREYIAQGMGVVRDYALKAMAAAATLSPATSLNDGLMSKADKVKLDGMAKTAQVLTMHYYSGFEGAYDVTLPAKGWTKKTDTATKTVYYENKVTLAKAKAALTPIGFLTGYNAANTAGQVATLPDYRNDLYDQCYVEDGAVRFFAAKAYSNDLYAMVLLFGTSNEKDALESYLSDEVRKNLLELFSRAVYTAPGEEKTIQKVETVWKRT